MNKKNIILLILAIIFLIIAIVIFIFTTQKNSSDSTQNITNTTIIDNENEITEKFNFYDADGNNYTLEDFSDKPIALILWSSDSENALEIIEIAEEYYAQENYANSINFLVVNTNEPDVDIKQHILDAGDEFTIPIYYDINSSAYTEYYFSQLPYLVFINADGTINSEINLNESQKKNKSDLFEASLELLTFKY
jgi:hypothetical protein